MSGRPAKLQIKDIELNTNRILQGGNVVVNDTGTLFTSITAITPDTTAVFANQFTELTPGGGTFGVAQAGGATTPTDGETGFSFGCIFANAVSGLLFLNVGNNASCAFRPLQLGQSARSGAGAIPLTAGTCLLTTTGANALTLANGVTGQKITIIMVVDGGAGTLTPTTATGFSTLTFDDVGDSATLEWVPTLGWMLEGTPTATVA